ncbi:Gpi17p [Sugiyamaella lignohabitans]|uniref:Gpi17p n=1 Tax=Sugiyamaella lignohabitans TaxID=796027 RepID=A0A167EC25_9ASCO|nr:Gpi17p [Sugiyamaella lignohabitans]ANB13890.1 Gpi17p [Sugiyamaella lignohabitans]
MASEEAIGNIRRRRWIVLSYLLLGGLIGLPIWIWTTSIWRAPLSYEEMDMYDHNIQDLINVKIPVYLNVGTEFPDLVKSTQLVVNRKLEDRGIKQWNLEILSGRGDANSYNVAFRLGEDDEYIISEVSRDVLITYSIDSVSLGVVPELVSIILVDHLFADELSLLEDAIGQKKQGLDNSDSSDKIVSYSPNYHLTFSLFYGGGDKISWDISQALDEHFAHLKESYARISNLTIDTQVQYYSDLGCNIHHDEENNQWLLDHNDLSTFVNFAEWSLTSIHSYPTLHFILYIPSPKQSPMIIVDSNTNSFSIPQWGGVQIWNKPEASKSHLTVSDLLPILETFSSQFLGLVGAPVHPKSPVIRLDFLSRLSTIRALISASHTLGSLHRLSQSLPDIAIPQPVLYAVKSALLAIQGSLYSLSTGQFTQAIKLAGDALRQSENAFFEKEMVQQAFFPEEHKVAIYLPLLGPIGIVLLMGTLRCFKEFKTHGW